MMTVRPLGRQQFLTEQIADRLNIQTGPVSLWIESVTDPPLSPERDRNQIAIVL